MKNLLIKKIMFYRIDMDIMNDYEDIQEGYSYLMTLSNKDLIKILIDWKYNR